MNFYFHSSSVLYTCWGSDLVALTLLIPAGGLSMVGVCSCLDRDLATEIILRQTDSPPFLTANNAQREHASVDQQLLSEARADFVTIEKLTH